MDVTRRAFGDRAQGPRVAPLVTVSAAWLAIDVPSAWSALSVHSISNALSVLLQMVLLAIAAGTVLSVAVWTLFAGTQWIAGRMGAAQAPRRVFAASSVCGLLTLIPLASTLSAISRGAWISEQSWLPAARFAVMGLGFMSVTWLWGLALRSARGTTRQVGAAAAAFGALAVALLFLDQMLFVGRQESFHRLLSVAALSCMALGTLLATFTTRRPSTSNGARIVAGIGLATTVLLAAGVLPRQNPITRALLFNDAPLTGRLLRVIQPSVNTPLNADADFLAMLRASTRVSPEKLDGRFPYRRNANLIVITIDTLRADALGLHGHTGGLTPNIDAFGRESVVFNNAYTQHPSSQLAMASMFKGLYPLATDVYASLEPRFFGRAEKPHQPMLAEHLRHAGRETAAVTAFGEGIFNLLFAYLADGFDRCNDYPNPKTLDGSEVEAHAVRELETLPAKPYFLWVHLFDPHDPYDPPSHPRGATQRELYDLEVAQADACLGRILDAARKRSDWDETVVIVHSDHGEEFDEHGGRHHHSTLFDEQVRVPLILRIPGQSAKRVEPPVELMDIPETLFDLMGIDGSKYGHGQSLLPYLFDGAGPAPIAFSQLHAPGQHISRRDSVRVGQWKLIHDLISDTTLLFDLSRDPEEHKNLAHTNPSQLQLMRRWLDSCSTVLRGARPTDIVNLPDDALLAALEDLEGSAVQSAIGRLIAAGRVEPLLPVLTRFIDPGVGLNRCRLALRYVSVSGYKPALPQIINLLSAQPEFEKVAALALSHYRDDAIRAALQSRIAHHGPDAPWWLYVAAGLQGDPSAEAPLLAFLPETEDAEAEYLRALALTALRLQRGVHADTGILETTDLSRHLQMAALSIARHYAADDVLPVIFDAVRRTTIPFNVLNRIIATLDHYPLQAAAPIYRALAEQHDPSVRERAAEKIASLTPPPAEDWGTVLEAFWEDAAERRADSREVPDIGSHLLRFQERLRAFRKNLNVSAKLILSPDRDIPTSLRTGTLWAVPLHVACASDGGAAIGGEATGAPSFHISLRRRGGQQSKGVKVFRLPVAGLLPGESTQCLPMVRIPAVPLGDGYEMVVRIRSSAVPPAVCNELAFPITIH